MNATPWWWISFASETAPLGVAIVQAPTMPAALARARELGINPGGEAVGSCASVPDYFGNLATDVLHSPEDLDRIGIPSTETMTNTELADRDNNSTTVEEGENL